MDDDRYIPDGGGDPYAVRDDDPYADARPMNDTDRFNRNPFDDRMRQTPSPSGQLHLDEFFLHQPIPSFFTRIVLFFKFCLSCAFLNSEDYYTYAHNTECLYHVFAWYSVGA